MYLCFFNIKIMILFWGNKIPIFVIAYKQNCKIALEILKKFQVAGVTLQSFLPAIQKGSF